MTKFHFVYRFADEFVTTGTVIEAEDTEVDIDEEHPHLLPAIVVAINQFHEQYPGARIIAINTQELVDLMSSARG